VGQNQVLQRTVLRLSGELQEIRSEFTGLQTRVSRLKAVPPPPIASLIAPSIGFQ
jgi:hypothetical protein